MAQVIEWAVYLFPGCPFETMYPPIFDLEL